MLALLHLWRWGRAKYAAWAATHRWGGLIVGAIMLTALDGAVRSPFSHLAPALSEVVSSTVDRMMPIVFLASGALLLVMAASLTLLIVRASSSRRTAGPALPSNKAVLTVLVLLGCAGVAFLDAHLVNSAPRPIPRLDR